MIKSINRCITLSGLSETEIEETKNLPNLFQLYEALGINPQVYTAIQRMGSHAVHGTWSELLFNYLHVDEESGFSIRDHDVDTRDAHFIVVLRLVSHSMISFLSYIKKGKAEIINSIISEIERIDSEIVKIQDLAWMTGFDKVD